MVSVISQYRLVDALNVSVPSAQSTGRQVLGRLGEGDRRNSPAKNGASTNDPSDMSFDKLLEVAVSHYAH